MPPSTDHLTKHLEIQLVSLRQATERGTVPAGKGVTAILTLARAFRDSGLPERQREAILLAERLALTLAPQDAELASDVAASRRSMVSEGPVERGHRLPPAPYLFQGRNGLVERIRDLLPQPCAALTRREVRLGGAGAAARSAAAIAFGHQYGADYPGGVFLLSADPERLVADLAEMAAALGTSPGRTWVETAKAVLAHFERGPRALLILDGAASTPGSWLPDRSCDVLMAGRAEASAAIGAPQVTIDTLSREELAQLLRSARPGAEEGEIEGIRRLVEAVGGSMLAVTLVAAIMVRSPLLAWSTYADSLEVAARDGRSVKLAVIADALALCSPAAHRALEYAVVLPRAGFPRAWLAMLLAGDDTVSAPDPPPGEMSARSRSAEGVNRAIDELQQLGLVELTADGGATLAVHADVAAAVLDLGAGGTDGRALLLDAISALADTRGPLSRRAAEDTSARWELAPLVRLAAMLGEAGRLPAAVRLANCVQEPLRHLGRHAESRHLLELLAGVGETPGEGVEPADRAALLNNLAMALQAQGDLAGAKSRMHSAIEILERGLDTRDPVVATAYANLAGISHDLGELPAARSLIERAIAMDIRTRGPRHPGLASRYSTLALLMRDEGRLGEAKALMTRAIEITEAAFGPGYPALAAYRVNLGTILKMLGQMAAAEALTRRAIDFLEAEVSPDGATLALSYSNLALIRQQRNSVEDARRYMRRSIELEEAVRGPGHPRLAASYANMAAILAEAGEPGSAREFIERAEAIAQRSLGPEHATSVAIRRWRVQLDAANHGRPGAHGPGPHVVRGHGAALVRRSGGSSQPRMIITNDLFNENPGVGLDVLLPVDEVGEVTKATVIAGGGGQTFEALPWVDSPRPRAGRGWGRSAAKRAFDVVFSAAVLVATAPLFPLIALAIVLEDGRPVLFGHRREGRHGREFLSLKFRTMFRNVESIRTVLAARNLTDGPQFFISGDPRVTRVGRFLRRYQLDELPQFVNVLRGEMSVVGPRPSPYSENQFSPAWREARLSVRPGVTGLWQVRRSMDVGSDFQEWLKYDIEYVERQSLSLDLWIIWRSVTLSARRALRLS